MNLSPKKPLAAALATAGALAIAASPVSAVHERGELTVGLNGANEVGTVGDPNGSGKIRLEFFDAVDNPTVVFPGQHYVCYALTFRNVDAPTGLHIHEVSGNAQNPRRDAGPVVVDLLGDVRTSDGASCVAMSDDVFDGVASDPADYYVNLHNPAFPNGAIRGQLHAFNA